MIGYFLFTPPSEMPADTNDPRITYNPDQCGGRPCIRGMRIRASDILEMLANGVTEAQILTDFPDLEVDDIKACLRLAAARVDTVRDLDHAGSEALG